jgi:hypothetical protein
MGIQGGGSYLSSSDSRLFFSLADDGGTATVKWPNGATETFAIDAASTLPDSSTFVWIEGHSNAGR